MEMGAPPGSVRVFVGPDMDRQLEGTKKTAHEVALADLIQAARLAGCAPRHRALVAVQPASTEWGLEPTPAVNAAIPEAVRCVLAAIGDWAHE